VGGTITVGGVTRTITAIASSGSLTTDVTLGTFSGQAFTCQTGVIQTGTDTMNLGLGEITGFLVTNRADLFRTFDVRGQDFFIEGTLTVDSRVAQLRNDGSCSNRFEVRGSATGGNFTVNGRKAAAANAPFPYPGFDWLGQNGQKVMKLVSTNASFPALFTMIDACIRYGSDWLTTDSGNFSKITTQGDVCWILGARGTGTSQARLRQDNTTASIDFQANKTFVGVWLNFGVPQFSIKGYTPIDTDGPEINLASVPTASRIVIEDYLTTYVLPSYYAGVQIVLLGSAWTRLKNNLLGTNIAWRSSSSSGGRHNVLEFSKQITIRAQDTAGNLLSDGFMYYQPVGSNVAGVRAKGGTVDITFDLSQQAIATVGGAATSEFVFAWGFTTATTNLSSYSYFCTGTTRGAETHMVYSTRYGYETVGVPVSLAGNGAATPTFVHTSLPTTNKDLASAAAITGVTFNFATKTWTNATGSTRTVQEMYDAYQLARNQPANLGQPNDCAVTGDLRNWVGWTGINNGTITAGAAGLRLGSDTITNNGSITAIYSSSAGTSTILELRGVKPGASYVVANNSTKATILFGTNGEATAQTYPVYFPPGSTGLQVYVARKAVGDFFDFEVITLEPGLIWTTFVDIPDEGAKETDPAVLNAYTALETNTKLYNYVTGIYQRTEEGIKLGNFFFREGKLLKWVSPYSAVVDQSAGSLFSKSSNLFTIKANGLAADENYDTNVMLGASSTLTAATNEVLGTNIEDSAGNSSVEILGGDGDFELWKVTTATATADYATGTKLADVTNEKYRFIGVTGFDIVGVDTLSNIRRRTSMAKGIYSQSFYVGEQIQLAQAPQVNQINSKVDLLQVAVDALPVTIWDRVIEAGYTAKKIMRLMSSVLLGKVSGAGTATETFRDINDTKDRVIADVDNKGNRTNITRDPD
jgi:hypothetical protein